MKRLLKAACAVAALAAAQPAFADTVCEWIDFAQRLATASPAAAGSGSALTPVPSNPELSRAQTRVALAMFEALNAIDRRYQSYLNFPQGDANASQEAAAVTAAYQVLLHFYPSQRAALEENYNIAMETVTDPARREAGRLIGEAAAQAAINAGGIDPAIAQTPYRPRTAPGEWVATALPVFQPYTIAFRPWILPRADAVRPGPPPALTSERWARDYDEVRRLGGRESTARTPHQTLMARYRITPDMMPSLRYAADASARAPVENARMFALMGMVLDDTSMATGEAKLHYNFWRPVTAIRNGEVDNNPATQPDPAWEPLIATPNHPEYPCAHCSTAGAVAEVMTAEVGARPAYGVRVSSRSIPSAAVQVLPSWDDWVREVNFSRTLGGVHYRFSNEAGEEIGRRVARMALQNVMQPLPARQQRRAR
ncbi:MAG: vanadium-dependent haloperoxidase [Allosphingosinicella sp.]|uniref:vanadium-dependent haloperoxidase n=1 Tax=Allosphingosinicella sp. TaxID=2823234 RepID=UPI0039285E0C